MFIASSQAGPVQKVIIPKDRDGNQKSYGFVYYKHAEAVPYAIALLDGIWLYGCPITLRHHYGERLLSQKEAVLLFSGLFVNLSGV